MSLVVDILTHAGALTVLAILVCAVILNVGERRHRREAHMDVGDRQRIRAASQEALAKHQLFSVPAADRRVEKTWRKAS